MKGKVQANADQIAMPSKQGGLARARGGEQNELDSARERWREASEELRQTRQRVAELRAALVAAQRQLEAMPPRPVAPLPPVKLDSCGQARPIRYS